MRFSDSTHFDIPKPIKYANSDSSFNFNESPSDEDSSQNDSNSHSLPPITSNCDSTNPSNDSSPIKRHDNPHFKKIIKTHQTNPPIDRSRHPSQNQSTLPHPPIDKTTNTH